MNTPTTTASATVRKPTPGDHAALQAFAADLTILDWREGVRRYTSCPRGKRLMDLGWLQLHQGPLTSSGGFMRGRYHPATYYLTSAGGAELDRLAATTAGMQESPPATT